MGKREETGEQGTGGLVLLSNSETPHSISDPDQGGWIQILECDVL
jgi:hypothetical protein